MAENCIFCTPEKLGVVRKLNDDFYLNIDSFPVAPGHCEIIPVSHRVSMRDLTADERISFWDAYDKAFEVLAEMDLKAVYEEIMAGSENPVVSQYCERILKAPYFGLPIEQFNSGNNDGPNAGRTVHHFHYHIIPRYEGDIAYLRSEAGLPIDEIENFARGGIRKILPFGDYKK